MIAAAGPTEGLQPRAALSLLACIVVCLTTVLMMTPSTTILGKVPLKVPPEELSIRARDLARRLGFSDVAAGTAAGFDYDAGYLTRTAQTIKGSNSDRQQQWNARLASAPWPIGSLTFRVQAASLGDPGVVAGALPASEALLEPGRMTTTLDSRRPSPQCRADAHTCGPCATSNRWTRLDGVVHRCRS